MENVIKGPWTRSPQHACNICGQKEGRAGILHGVIVCYSCITELYWAAVQHETQLRKAGDTAADLFPVEYSEGLK